MNQYNFAMWAWGTEEQKRVTVMLSPEQQGQWVEAGTDERTGLEVIVSGAETQVWQTSGE